ncbi:MAG: PQQ-dependent sugar dehydrogenase, partial [Pirellulales bacterium]
AGNGTKHALAAAPGKAAVRRPFGIEKRVPWTTGKIVGTPEPPNPYRTEPHFTNLKKFSDPAKSTFDQPLELATVPGQNRLCVVERLGKIYTFRNAEDVERAELMIDIGKTCYGLAFHPQFAENGLVFVTNVLDPANPSEKGTRVSRFKASGNPPVCDPASEKIIIEWPSGGHNGGCLQFGPDGYLYIVTGDGSGIADELQTGQDVSDLLASMLRIDIDKPTAGRAYGIPADNPLVETPGARPEIWAYGLRQAWKFNFDPANGELWAGEVGQDLWEMVYRIERGGNYGWSIKEGTHPFRPERKPGPSPIIPPIVEHSHTAFRSITGGHVYHGQRQPELEGAYIYGDYDTGKVWGLRYQSGQATWSQELVDTQFRIIDFGQDESGEVYLLDFIGGRLHRLVKAPPAVKTADFPRLLSQTGLFASTKDHIPTDGLIPYSVNAPLWSDGAEKDRFIAVPGNSRIEYNTVEYPQPAPGAPPGWRFPDGTVIVKTFSLDLEEGNAASRRRLETRLLHLELLAGNEEVGDQVWRGYTYVWNDDQTDAELLEAAGADRKFTIADKSAEGGKREQIWHFPSRTECTLCHTMPGKYVLGLNTLQMNKDHDYGGTTANQLDTLQHLGLFTKPLPDRVENLPKLADYRDASQPLDARARSYLHANCAHCHMKWGGGNAEFQLLATLDLKDTGTLLTRPGQGPLGIADARIIVPGDPARSLVHHRMTRLGLGRMPHIASTVVDQDAVELIGEWIQSLKP